MRLISNYRKRQCFKTRNDQPATFKVKPRSKQSSRQWRVWLNSYHQCLCMCMSAILWPRHIHCESKKNCATVFLTHSVLLGVIKTDSFWSVLTLYLNGTNLERYFTPEMMSCIVRVLWHVRNPSNHFLSTPWTQPLQMTTPSQDWSHLVCILHTLSSASNHNGNTAVSCFYRR